VRINLPSTSSIRHRIPAATSNTACRRKNYHPFPIAFRPFTREAIKADMGKPIPAPTPAEIESGWLQADIAMECSFAYPIWRKQFHPARDLTREERLMETAALQTTLLNIRAVNEFFGRGIVRAGDIRAIHFHGFQTPGAFLTDTEATQLHHFVGHITYTRMHEFLRTWPVAALLERTYGHFRLFLEHMHDVASIGHVNVQAAIRNSQRRYERWLGELQADEESKEISDR
jgi:hypothetical protein